MSTEDAFLTQLAADPGDDVTRLVYADWLDEQGDPRAGFLRAEQELAGVNEDDPRARALSEELDERMRSLRWEWVSAAGKRWDVWLAGYPRTRKIPVIKTLRELTGCGLLEGKLLAESAPVCVLSSCTRLESTQASQRFRAAGTDADGPVTVAIRPCRKPSAQATHETVGWCRLVLQGLPIGSSDAMIAALRARLPYANPWFSSGQLGSPWVSKQNVPVAVEVIREFAEVEVSPQVEPERRIVTIPIFASLTGSGPFEVRLLSYPPEVTAAVIEAVRELKGILAIDAAQRAERPPVVLRLGVDGAEAERVRRIFAVLGTVEITTANAH